jgi:hypothetical protein
MNTRLQTAIALGLLGLATLAVTHRAQACGLSNGPLTAARNWAPRAYTPYNQTLRHPGQQTAIANDLQSRVPITGMYRMNEVAEGNGPGGPPDGTPFDFGYQTFHADGTELLNSGSRPPPSTQFCQGIWARTGERTYSVNHFALTWDNTGTVYLGPANVREDLTLSKDHNSFSGDFNVTQYAPDGVTVIAHVQGNVTATRLTMDSTN